MKPLRTRLQEARKRLGLPWEVLEGDYFLSWVLAGIAQVESLRDTLVFKGGTSLSKVYEAIDRFSEDVDLSFDRSALGFGGDNDPAKAPSRQQESKRLEGLSSACREMIRDWFLPQLRTAFAAALGAAPSQESWQLDLAQDDPDAQTLLFHYPAGVGERDGSMARYQLPVVRLELGARVRSRPAGRTWPTSGGTTSSRRSRS